MGSRSNRGNVGAILAVTVAAFAVLLLAAFLILPGAVERRMNAVLVPSPYAVTPEFQALHDTLTIADLHADSLLWGRDLLQRGNRGHVDVPRLIEANVALQIFSVVTKTPRGLNIERNDDRSDNILPLALVQGWPLRTWSSLTQRALYQASRLRAMAADSQGRLVPVRTRRELQNFIASRAKDRQRVAAVLAIEGAQALDGDPANVDVLFDAGFRMMSPTHFFDDEMAGSAHGIDKGGLTDKGREMIRRMEEKHMIVDLAHASAKTIDEILDIATRPVVVSHGGVKGTCDNNRNLSDAQLSRIADNGGLVGIGYWVTAVCGDDAQSIAKAILYAAARVGIDHVALGSDFDGAVAVPFDTTGLVLITQALQQQGMADADIAKVMGGNQIAFLAAQLPE